MATFVDILNYMKNFFPIIRTIVVIIIFFIIFKIILNIIKKILLRKAKTKKNISNIKIFSRILSYTIGVLLVIFAIFTYAGSWTGLGLSVGLFSAALGWALQKPITGIAGWIMVVVKRPFEIGDRIIIGGVKGDVADITLTHIYIGEVGGLVAGEENSGRTIMIPNSKLFETEITNYTLEDDYVLDQVVLTVTYDSDLDKAIKISEDAARKITKDFIAITKKQPLTRIYFQPSGINLNLRYHVPAKKIPEISSSITKEIFDNINKAKGVRFAFPHTEVILDEKNTYSK